MRKLGLQNEANIVKRFPEFCLNADYFLCLTHTSAFGKDGNIMICFHFKLQKNVYIFSLLKLIHYALFPMLSGSMLCSGII